MKYIFVLGRHTALSEAEIKAVIGETGERFGRFLLMDVTPPPTPGLRRAGLPGDLIHRLGGIDRIVEVLSEKDHAFTAEEIVITLPHFEQTKITLGISGLSFNQAKSLGSALKRLLRQQNKSLRFITPKGKASLLNAAQVLFNSLLTSQNIELVFTELGGRFYVGKTVQIQDIQAYEQRDTARPVRDAKVGMLPPKLAQIMLNIAVGPTTGLTIYDPFCGTGVVLQEGWLMGHTMIGSDSNPKMVAASEQNLEYLSEHYPLRLAALAQGKPRVFKHDVQQPFLENFRATIDAIVTEPYLGRPLSIPLSPLRQGFGGQAPQLMQLYKSFFTNAREILKPHGVILFLFPVFRQTDGSWAFFEEAFLDELAQLGYGRKQLGLRRDEAVYSRPDAVVGRELTLWQKH